MLRASLFVLAGVFNKLIRQLCNTSGDREAVCKAVQVLPPLQRWQKEGLLQCIRAA